MYGEINFITDGLHSSREEVQGGFCHISQKFKIPQINCGVESKKKDSQTRSKCSWKEGYIFGFLHSLEEV